MNAIQQFTNGELGVTVRVVDQDGEPWFVAKDVAEALGYAKPRNAVAAHCKGGLETGLPSGRGEQQTTIIPEADVYRLVLRSKLPAAEAFQDWIVEEVLPSIRKHGTYMTPAAREAMRSDPASIHALLDRLVEDEVRLRGLEAMRADCAPLEPFGSRSPKTGRKREKLIRAYWRTARKHHEPPPWLQNSLFPLFPTQ